jgi:hypothetical protein
VRHTCPVTTTPAEPTPSVPVVPYGGAVDAVDAGSVPTSLSAQGVAKGVGKVAVSIGVRTIIVFLIRAIFRAAFKR